MAPAKGELVLVHEPEAACRARLVADGFPPERALEITSYLAQSTDLALEFAWIAEECAERGLSFTPVELDNAASALARLGGFRTIGSDDSLFALCQDKLRSGAVLTAFGLPSPACGLARDGKWL